jgi:phospholipid/cholesterol/gamma-HCH transport system substrate-binding protein
VSGSLEKLQRTVDNLDRTLKNTESISNRMEKGEGTVGRLLNDDTIARNVEDITEDASGFIRSITKLQTIVGLRTDYNFISHTFKNYLQIQLVPRPDKFYLIELVEDPRGYRSATSTVTDSSKTGVTSEQTVTITDRLRFTLMFGKRVGILGGRFGIKESTGGVGVDLHLFDDRLNLSVDIFDARTNQYPRIKPSAALAVWKRSLFLIGGGDDLANLTRPRAGAGGGIDWFLGAQLVFNDEDLRSLLLLGGGAAAGAASK